MISNPFGAARQMRPRRTSSGFTLIEVMLALAILGFITTIMWGSFAQTANSKRAVEAAQERTHTVRVALMRMAREIEMAYLSDTENTASRTAARFVGVVARRRRRADVLHLRPPAPARRRRRGRHLADHATSARAIRTTAAS